MIKQSKYYNERGQHIGFLSPGNSEKFMSFNEIEDPIAKDQIQEILDMLQELSAKQDAMDRALNSHLKKTRFWERQMPPSGRR